MAKERSAAISVWLKCNCFRASYFFNVISAVRALRWEKGRQPSLHLILPLLSFLPSIVVLSLRFFSVVLLLCFHFPPSPLLFLVDPSVLLLHFFLIFILFLSSQFNVQPTRCVLTQRGWSWVQATLKTTRICRCAPGWSTWRRVTTSLCTSNFSRRRKSLTSWKYLMVGSFEISMSLF